MRATDGTLRFMPIDGNRHRIVSKFVATSTFLALVIGVFLLARRMTGAFSSPLPIPQLMSTAFVATAWAVMVRDLSQRSPFYISLALIVLLIFALACSYPGARVIDWLIWPTALFATVLYPPIVRPAAKEPAHSSKRSTNTLGVHDDVKETTAELILQQLTRVRTEVGHEAIRGTLIGEFVPGERQVTLNVAFCPPFERLPQVEVNVSDDSVPTVKLTQVLHNGAQLEVRLPHPAAENTTVALEFFATDARSN